MLTTVLPGSSEAALQMFVNVVQTWSEKNNKTKVMATSSSRQETSHLFP